MAILGELGIVNDIDCLALPKAGVIREGELMSVPAADELESWVPANCPRREDFDESKMLGCVSCRYAQVEYNDSMVDC